MTRFTIKELSNNKYYSVGSSPQISGDNVVWSKWNSWNSKNRHDNEIFFYDGNKTIKISNANVSYPRIFGEKVVWAGIDSDGDREIFLYSGKETIQLTNNNVDDTSPKISRNNIIWTIDTVNGITILLDNGQDVIQLNEDNLSNSFPKMSGDNVAWITRDSNKKEELFFYNGKETIQISRNEHQHIYRFQVSENKVVWTARDSKGKKQIFLYNGKEAIQISENSKIRDSSSRTEGKKVIWKSKLSNPNSGIFLDNKKTIELTRAFNLIFGGDTDDLDPRILGENVVWKSERNLFLYDGREVIQLDNKDKNVRISSLQISGNNIVWTARDSDDYGETFPSNVKVGTTREIFLYDGKETIQLTDNHVADYSPQISGNNIVWQSGKFSNSQIFLYDGKETIQLTDKNSSNISPKIDGKKIVWERLNFNQDEPTTSVMLASVNEDSSSSLPLDLNQKFITSSTIIILGLIFLCWLKKLQVKW